MWIPIIKINKSMYKSYIHMGANWLLTFNSSQFYFNYYIVDVLICIIMM